MVWSSHSHAAVGRHHLKYPPGSANSRFSLLPGNPLLPAGLWGIWQPDGWHRCDGAQPAGKFTVHLRAHPAVDIHTLIDLQHDPTAAWLPCHHSQPVSNDRASRDDDQAHDWQCTGLAGLTFSGPACTYRVVPGAWGFQSFSFTDFTGWSEILNRQLHEGSVPEIIHLIRLPRLSNISCCFVGQPQSREVISVV